MPLSVAALGAFAIDLLCAFMRAPYRREVAAWRVRRFSRRNDVPAHRAIFAAGTITAATRPPWPGLLVGVGIFGLNLDAARVVCRAVRAERRKAGAAA